MNANAVLRHAGLVALALTLIGCGGSSATPAPGSTPQSGATQGPTGQVLATPAVVQPGSAVDACSLLSDADIEAATDRTIATKTHGPVQGIFSEGCAWELTPGEDDMVGWSIEVGVVSPGGSNYFDRYFSPFEEPLAGVGDKAVSQEAGGIAAVKGDTLVSVFVIAFGGDEDAITRNLIDTALAHVP